MRAIGKVSHAHPKRVEYVMDGWKLAFGPSIGNPGHLYVALENPRGWETMEWFKTRRELFEWVEARMARYKELFVK